jgi:hypothetical protein
VSSPPAPPARVQLRQAPERRPGWVQPDPPIRVWLQNGQPWAEFERLGEGPNLVQVVDLELYLRAVEEGRPPSSKLLKALRRGWRNGV